MVEMKRRGVLAMATLSLFSALGGCGVAKTRPFAGVADFRDFVMAALKRQRGVDSVVADAGDPAKFKVTMGDWSSTSDVTNMFGYLKAYPNEDAEKVVGRFIKAIANSRDLSIDENNIVAVVRSKDYIDQLLGSGLDVVQEPLGADLVVLYMIDLPDSMASITSTDLPGKDLASIRKIALDNMRKRMPKIVADDTLGIGSLYSVEDNAMLSTGLILLDEFWTSIASRFSGDVLIALPRRDQLFVFKDDGNPALRAGVRRLIGATIQENVNLLSPRLYARRGGKIVVVSD